MAYQPIENYGIIGNMNTVALVAMNGSIDWLCYPHFDSPSVFAAILDDEEGGASKSLPPQRELPISRSTGPRPTCWSRGLSRGMASVEVVDFMPAGVREGEQGFHQLVRRSEA